MQMGTVGERFVREKFATTAKEVKNFDEFPPALADLHQEGFIDKLDQTWFR